MRRLTVLPRSFGAVAVLAVALAAYGSSAAAAAPPKTATPSTTAVPASGTPAASGTPSGAGGPLAALRKIGPATASGRTLSLAKGKQGIFLVGPNGHTLYIYAKDKGTVSACTGACAKTWPALTATGARTFGLAVASKDVSTANGQVAHQVTYYGHLLYYFAGDKAPGQTNGTKVSGWDLLGPFGNVMLPRV
jgi:predicted lipoprotein with Yx(FWY)xxD motif